jgi:hypothetical protein
MFLIFSFTTSSIDFKNKIEFMLTVNIYVNEKNVIGNGNYQYEKTGLPFLKDLSWCFYNFEYSRKRLFLPDLSAFGVCYNLSNEQQDW